MTMKLNHFSETLSLFVYLEPLLPHSPHTLRQIYHLGDSSHSCAFFHLVAFFTALADSQTNGICHYFEQILEDPYCLAILFNLLTGYD